MLKKYKLRFDGPGFGLFLLIMVPNVVWMIAPPAADPLGVPSVTPQLDLAAAVMQAVFVAALCLVQNRRPAPLHLGLAAGIGGCVLGYFLAWGCYYSGVLHPVIFLSMCVLPCLALLLYAGAKRNYAALAPGVVYAIFHSIYGICNFLR